MQKWYATLALACGCSIAAVGAVTAQVAVQVQVQQGQAQVLPVQAQPAQALPVQVQIMPAQAVPAQFQPAQGKMIARPGGPGFGAYPGSRLTPVDAVFVGRVVAFEPMDVEAEQTPKGAKATYRVAVVEISETILGVKKDTKQVRVAFIVQGNNGPGIGLPPGAGGGAIQIMPVQAQPAIQPLPGRVRPGIRFPGAIQLQMGQEGLFSVNKHHKETFFLSPDYQHFVDRQNNPGFDNEIKTAKQLSKVMADPVKSLKSDDKQDRYTAAAILVAKYRMPANPNGQAMKEEQIDAEESKLILKAMAEGDWTANKFGGAIPAPYELFGQLGINDYKQPGNVRTPADAHQAMQKWLEDNNGKYRINKMVVDPNAKVQPGFNPGGPNVRPPIRIQPGVLPQPIPAPLPAPPVQRNDK
jgi:hypothetical protein